MDPVFFLFVTLLGFAATGSPVVPCEQLYHAVSSNEFMVTRGLEKYGDMLGLEFRDQVLHDLKPGDRWVDFGAGNVQAMTDLYAARVDPSRNLLSPPQMTAISFQVDAGALKKIPAGVEVMHGRFFEDISDVEIKPFKVGTDPYGIGSYTPKLSEYFSRVLNKMNRDGTFYLYTHARSTSIKVGDQVIFLDAWLKNIPGLKIENAKGRRALIIRKTQDKIKIPRLELLETVSDYNPPKRIFRQLSDSDNAE